MSGPMCFSNPPKLSSTCGAGNVEEIVGLQTYVTGRRDSHRAILLIADAFGNDHHPDLVDEFSTSCALNSFLLAF